MSHGAEKDAPETPACASSGCERSGHIKSERFGAYLCATHAVSGPASVDLLAALQRSITAAKEEYRNRPIRPTETQGGDQ